MTAPFFSTELEGVATFWRIMRGDGVALAFTSHNRPLRFDGITHLAAPGMLPSAIRRTAKLERDSVEVQGILSHDAISEADLESGRFANASVIIGLVNWESLQRATLFHGSLGNVSAEDTGFTAELRSAKATLEQDFVPRTSPTCRAAFCDSDCRLNPAAYTHFVSVVAVDGMTNAVSFAGLQQPASYLQGQLRWVDGPHAGMHMQIVDVDGQGLIVDQPLSGELKPGHRAFAREGCDHTIGTCSGRFGNAVNFQGEPFLPGNDVLTRYPTSSS